MLPLALLSLAAPPQAPEPPQAPPVAAPSSHPPEARREAAPPAAATPPQVPQAAGDAQAPPVRDDLGTDGTDGTFKLWGYAEGRAESLRTGEPLVVWPPSSYPLFEPGTVTASAPPGAFRPGHITVGKWYTDYTTPGFGFWVVGECPMSEWRTLAGIIDRAKSIGRGVPAAAAPPPTRPAVMYAPAYGAINAAAEYGSCASGQCGAPGVAYGRQRR